MQSHGQRKIVCERTDREESVCEFTVCVFVCMRVCDKGRELDREWEGEIKRDMGKREREEMRGWCERRERGGRQ